jgi:hypothetical protein
MVNRIYLHDTPEDVDLYYGVFATSRYTVRGVYLSGTRPDVRSRGLGTSQRQYRRFRRAVGSCVTSEAYKPDTMASNKVLSRHASPPGQCHVDVIAKMSDSEGSRGPAQPQQLAHRQYELTLE